MHRQITSPTPDTLAALGSGYDILTPPSDLSMTDSPPELSPSESSQDDDENPIPALVLPIEDSHIIPSDLYNLASVMRYQFFQHVGVSSAGNDESLPQESLVEIITDFLDFISKRLLNWPGADRTSRRRLLGALLDHLERNVLTDDIHTIAVRSFEDPNRSAKVIRSYYSAYHAAGRPIPQRQSALQASVSSGDSKLYAVLGGQGITTAYLEELREIYATYHGFLVDFIETVGEFLKSLASQPDVSQYYLEGLDIVKWLRHPETTPDVSYLASPRVSFPIIGVLQLSQYMVTVKVLGQSPSTFNSHLSGIAGHSQGLVVATIISSATSWPSFIDLSRVAIEILFLIGTVSQQVYPETSPDPKLVSDSVTNDEGVPSSMLSIRGISEAHVQEHIDVSNKYLPEDRRISIALANGPRNFVVAGPATSLCGLNARLRQFKVSADVDQNRIPFKERKATLTNLFLPISVPFHTNYLLPAITILRRRLGHILLPSNSLQIPVYDTNSGEDISTFGNENLLNKLVHQITVAPVRWLKCSSLPSATHIIDFGPGGSSGIGVVTSHNKQGTGVRVVMAGALTGKSADVGYKLECFSRNPDSVVKLKDWAVQFAPKLIRTADGTIHIKTKMSKLLHMPPIMVAGMTPTTVSWRFVSATINAGYHIELAGGGYRNEADMSAAINNIQASIPPGRGITVNIIYVDPRAVAWQIPFLEKLHGEGTPIDGLTIGAGVPSVEIAQKYISDLGLRHIAFKPSSVKTIKQVIGIAKANPSFPIILQWTGGRAGGHHSFEDFHAPILEVYGQIRECENIILVAGSGFGSATDAYPYFTGKWSEVFGSPSMPFDGVLLGSRMMTAREAATSVGAKQKIVETEGLTDCSWEKTLKGAAGGVITVISEMGEPIHVLATRGMKFWAEMDTFFKMGKDQMLSELQKKSSYIIEKLNDDFQKPWFGKNADGEAVLLKKMTYSEVLIRMVELMFISARGEWIDQSLKILTGEFIRRVEERFASYSVDRFILSDYADLDDPQAVLDTLVKNYPSIQDRIITPLDVQFFLSLCLRPGKKPVPFVPVLDENLSFYFKKDSLWQSENLWAVVGNDADRTQILHGPIAAQHSTKYDEPVQEILEGIKDSLISSLLEEKYGGTIKNVLLEKSLVEILPAATWSDYEGIVSIIESPESTTYEICSASDELPEMDSWLRLIAGDQYTWRYALFTSETVISGTKRLPNPIRRICTPHNNLRVTVENPGEESRMLITIQAASDLEATGAVAKIRSQGNQKVVVDCILSPTTTHVSPTLRLELSYHSDAVYAPIREISDGLIDEVSEFYRCLWFGSQHLDFNASPTQEFSGETMTITREAINSFLQATGSSSEKYMSRVNQEMAAPLDFGIVIAWKALLQPIFLRQIGGNILKLVHLSNKFKRVEGASFLRAGDTVSTTSRITAIRIQDAGKAIEVLAVIAKEGHPMMEVVSTFLYRGKYTDFETTFERKVQAPVGVYLKSRKDVAILKSKPWFQFTKSDYELLGKTLIFRLETKSQVQNTQTSGSVFEKHSVDGEIIVASISHISASSSNPILRYLNTHGYQIEEPVLLEHAIPLHGVSPIELKRPMSSAAYAKISGDFNPIHVSHTFAMLAGLPGPIVHGMHTSSAIGSLLETWVTKGHLGAVRSFEASFVGMVLPDDDVEVEFWHTAMNKGRKVIKITAKKTESGEMVLKGEAEVEQPKSAYLFTGQGSQEQNMGMDLYASSPVARAVWDIADKFYLKTYGFEITRIVKENPKELTIHFGGVNGRRIRQNYLALTLQTTGDDGQPILEKVFKDIDEETESYTFRSPKGVLFATQFTQAAITLVELARYKDMEARGLIPEACNFAGHSLGEYPALAAFTQFMSIEQLVAVCFYRGMAMQVTVKRDENGASDYSLCAVNPSRVAKTFNEKMLRFITQTIAQETGWLLEIVNFNISNRQYVCAGELIALDCLGKVLDRITKGLTVEWINQPGSGTVCEANFMTALRSIIQGAEPRGTVIELKRGTGYTPLEGIDVPFHSTYLRPGVDTFRQFLASKIDPSNIDVKKLVNKWIPNLTGKPFNNDRKYFEYVFNLTGSVAIRKLLKDWKQVDLVL